MSPSELDEQRFGIRVAKGIASSSHVMGIVERCRAEGMDLLIVRVPVEDIRAAQLLEHAGARLMDTLVAYERSLGGDLPGVAVPPHVSIRAATAADADEAASLARKSFSGYVGHYHADPRLDPDACDEVYASWAARACAEPGVADVVLLAWHQERLIGLSALKVDGGLAEGTLDAIAPTARRQGLYGTLSAARMQRAAEEGADRMLVTTHLANRGAQAGLQRLGFTSSWAQHTFHLWFAAPVEPGSRRS